MILRGAALEAPIDIHDLLHSGLEGHPDETAMICAKTRRTWRALDQAIDNLAGHYLAMGLEPGDRVASLMPNRVELVIHYLACIKAGLVAVPLNYRYLAPGIDHALDVSGASLLVMHAERGHDLAASQHAKNLRLGTVCYGRGGREPGDLERLIAEPPRTRSEPVAAPEDPAVIFFTSGSTGKPKGVTHSFDTLGWILASCAEALEITGDDVILPGSSISHLGSFMWTLAGLAKGARIIVARTFDGDELLPLLRAHRPTVLCMLPAALMCLVREHGATREVFSSLRVCRGGGDKVPAELEAEFTALTGFPIDEGYGMTEIGLATLNPPSGLIKPGSVGQPVAGFEMVIRDGEGRNVNIGEDGMLWVRTRTATIGYWRDPKATAELVENGWLDTGDLMRADEDGYFWFRGRKKQIIVHDGSNIAPQEVEDALLEHGDIEAAGVIGVHDLIHGENVRAYVTLRPQSSRPSVQALIRFARERIGYKAPEEIVFLDEMPLNPTGKIDRVRLKEMAAQSHIVG
ncbi:MAG: class I adenylate-forming enzyme family protein [Pseudomonadota bacterium]